MTEEEEQEARKDVDTVSLMIEVATKHNLIEEVTRSYFRFRQQGDSPSKAAHAALYDFNLIVE